MDCPRCGSGGAYLGLIKVECINTACQHYKAPKEVPTVDPATGLISCTFDKPLKGFSMSATVTGPATKPGLGVMYLSNPNIPAAWPHLPRDYGLCLWEAGAAPKRGTVELLAFGWVGQIYIRGEYMGSDLGMCREFLSRYVPDIDLYASPQTYRDVSPTIGDPNGAIRFVNSNGDDMLILQDEHHISCPQHQVGGLASNTLVYATLLEWMRDAGCLP